MRVLVGCEYSGTVRDAFSKRGHDAWSCDILPTESELTMKEGKHIQGDVLQNLNDSWDLMIAHPPCTHLSAAGAPSWKTKQADGRQQEAINFVLRLWAANIPSIAIENPSGILSTIWAKPNQIINPFQFGDPFKKRTCLWLKNLPLLSDTNCVEPLYHFTSNSTRGGLLKDGTRKKSELLVRKAWDTGHERSKSFQGIANAMAAQWGSSPSPNRVK